MFIKTYNYLKLKTLPSSILNKCRVLLERNSKYRRITSQFGATFRNSKWTDYSLNNLTPLNDSLILNPFLKNINYILVCFILTLSLLSSNPTFFLTITNSPYSLLSTISAVYYLILDYSYILTTIVLNLTLLFISVYPLQLLISLSTNSKSSLTSNLFPILNKSQGIKKLENSSSSIINELYSDTNLFNPQGSSNDKVSFEFENAFYRVFLHNIELEKPNFSYRPLLELSPLSYKLNDNKFGTNNQPFSREASYLPNNTSKQNPINLSNYFYINNLEFKKVNFLLKTPELLNFSVNLTEQLNTINTLRWSYRYSNLHRRTMYNSHKLTESKKLLSSGFFDINITKENLWFSDKYARSLDSKKLRKSLKSSDLISSNWKLLYNTTFFKSLNGTAVTNQAFMNNYHNLLRLSHYESSFHFFLKRLSNFNNLLSNKVSSVPLAKVTTYNLNNSSSNNINTIYNLSLSNKVTQPKLINPTLDKIKDGVEVLGSSTFSKDLILIQKPSYVLTKKKVEILYNLTKYSPLSNNNLKYFDSKWINTKFDTYINRRFKLKQFKKSIKL